METGAEMTKRYKRARDRKRGKRGKQGRKKKLCKEQNTSENTRTILIVRV